MARDFFREIKEECEVNRRLEVSTRKHGDVHVN